MANHHFSFAGGELLSKIGAAWFVSYAYYDKIDKIRGMDIIFVTTAKTDEEARELLSLMGAPFTKA